MLLFVVCFGPKVHDSTVGFRTHSHASPSPFHPAPGVPRTEASQRREILGWPVFLASFLLDKALQTTSQDIPRHPNIEIYPLPGATAGSPNSLKLLLSSARSPCRSTPSTTAGPLDSDGRASRVRVGLRQVGAQVGNSN